MNQDSIHHPASEKDSATVSAIHERSAPFKGAMSNPSARPAYDSMIEAIPCAEKVTYETASVGGIPGVWCHPVKGVAKTALLYLHGGGYMVGSAQAYRHFAGQFASRIGVSAFVPDYRLAPENQFPAAKDDVFAAYKGLVSQGIERIALVGDSAGGGLALITLSLASKDAEQGQGLAPSCCVVMSPFTDLALTGGSHESKAQEDPFLNKQATQAFVDAYLGKQDPRQPTASPLYGQLGTLAPTQIHVGTSEILLDDSVNYAAASQKQGGHVEIHIWEGMPHVFPSSLGVLESAEQAMQLMAAFTTLHLLAQ